MIRALPDDMLVKVDRASMVCGLEVRVPFFDHRLITYSWQIPLSQKIKNGEGKWILKQLAYKHVPKDLLDRPKKSFEVPVAEWLCNELKDWAGDLLFTSSARRDERFNRQAVRRVWDEHQAKKQNHKDLIWAQLMFKSWEDKYKKYFS